MPVDGGITNKGRILGQNPDESLKIFPSCYSQLPLQLCLEISRNLLRFPQLLYTLQEEMGKPDRKLKPLP